MFTPFDIDSIADLDSEIARVHSQLTTFSAETEEYQKAVDQLSKLYKLKTEFVKLNLQAQKDFADHQLESDKNAWQEEQDERPFYERVDPNVVLTVAGNLVIGLLVIKYEQTGVIATRVRDFMKKI